MVQRKDDDKFARNSSVLEIRDPNSFSKNKKGKNPSEVLLQETYIEKKSFAERWKTNRFWLIKGLYYVLHTLWMLVMFVGGFIAWLISLLFI